LKWWPPVRLPRPLLPLPLRHNLPGLGGNTRTALTWEYMFESPRKSLPTREFLRMTRQSQPLTWGNKIPVAISWISTCASPYFVPKFSPSPSPSWCRRGCTVPGEGWSPAETEHSGEAPRRRRSSLRWRVRGASSLAATRIGTLIPRGARYEPLVLSRCAFWVVSLQRRASVGVSGVPRNCSYAPDGATRDTVDRRAAEIDCRGSTESCTGAGH
jgi:hypothetical protein